MSTIQNVFSIQYVRDHPGEFIVGCQPLIDASVRYYVKTKMFNADEKEDIIQTINEQLIGKIPTILEQFRGDADLRTYMGAIVQNICLKIHRDRMNEPLFIPLSDHEAGRIADPSVPLLIDDEIERFRVIMVLMYRERNKFLLCSKIYLDLAITEQDILRALPTIQTAGINGLLSTNGSVDHPKNLEKMFETAASAFSQSGKKRMEGDSLRRWTQRNIDHVLSLLNGDPPRYAHGVESLKVLIEEYTHSEYYLK